MWKVPAKIEFEFFLAERRGSRSQPVLSPQDMVNEMGEHLYRAACWGGDVREGNSTPSACYRPEKSEEHMKEQVVAQKGKSH